MFIGDLAGTLVVIFTIKGLLSLTSRRVAQKTRLD